MQTTTKGIRESVMNQRQKSSDYFTTKNTKFTKESLIG